jgi:hypothetical protein
VSGYNGDISVDNLLELQQSDHVTIIDFRSDYARELNGFIQGAILVPNGLDENGIETFLQ